MILVTGGCGFVGSHLVDALLEDGKEKEVAILDSGDLKDYWRGRIKTIRGDIRNPGDVGRAAKGASAIFHLAAQVRVPESIRNPRADLETNALGTLNVLEAARQNDARVLYASTAAVYGNPEYIPVDEKHPKNPISPYGVSKLAGENYCRAYANSYGMKAFITRFSNVYGPRNPKAVVYTFISAILRNRPITIDGTGGQKRDFIYVKDVAAGLLAAANADRARPGEAYNLSTGRGTSINQLAEALKPALGDFESGHGPARQGDIRESVLSNQKAKDELGFETAYGLEGALKETAEWVRKENKMV